MTRVTSPTPRRPCLIQRELKLSLALVITLTSDAPRQKIDARTAAYFSRAVGYLAVNNVRYFMLEQVNPGLMAIIWNLKICVIGLLYAPPFRRAFTRFQWAGAGLLVVGSTLAGCAVGRDRRVRPEQHGRGSRFGSRRRRARAPSASAVATEYAAR